MMDSPVGTELREVLDQYDLGELIDYEKNERGFVNTAYVVHMQAAGGRKRLFLRKYKRGIGEEELIFEHALIEHLVEAGSPVARIHHTRSGKSYYHRLEGVDDVAGAFYTVFDYLPGEDRFTWVDPILSDKQLADSAAVLARFHMDANGFTPPGRRVEPRIVEMLPVMAEMWSGCPARSKGTIFDAHLKERLEAISTSISSTLASQQQPEARALPEMVIHCDYHPGNLKFSGDRVTGVFDFDWSKVDLRLFDVGLALWYFCTSWRGAEDGTLRLEKVRTFLRSYQQTVTAHTAAAAITPHEAYYLPIMINAGNLYVLHWTVLDYFAKEVDPAEYLIFLDHSLRFNQWYGERGNCQALARVIASAI